MEKRINKTMDRQDLDLASARKIVSELDALIIQLKENNVKTSSWYGCFDLSGDKNSLEVINRGIDYVPLPNAVDDTHFPWFLYWEIVWLVLHNDFKPGQTVLDMGGSSSLFSYYLASKGLRVTTIDLQESLVENANYTANRMNWNLQNTVMDMRDLSFSEQFDFITSVCVFEHIPMYDRVEINKGIKNIIKPGGNFSITFDYRNPSRDAQINSPQDVSSQFITNSGLSPRGNALFFDNGKNYLLHPFYSDKVSKYRELAVENGLFNVSDMDIVKTENDYTFGALFLINKEDKQANI